MFIGRQQAEADYRVLLASVSSKADTSLLNFSESEVGNPLEHFEFDGKNKNKETNKKGSERKKKKEGEVLIKLASKKG